MIAPEIVAEVRRLLDEGKHSQRRIASLTGVSRGSVCAIATGRRSDYEKRPEEEEQRPAGPPRRCPGCGGMVYMPCLLCRAREEASAGRKAFILNGKTTPVRLELRGEHHARYLQVRGWRKRNRGLPLEGSLE